MGPFKSSQNFTVTVTNQCPSARITTSPIPSSISFEVGSANPLVVNFDEWVVNLIICGSFKYQLTKKDGSTTLEPFISFNPVSRDITI